MHSLLPIIISLISIAFFAGVETAFISANRLRIELKRQQGTLRGRLVGEFFRRPSDFLVSMLVGNTIILILVGKSLDSAFEPFLGQYFTSEWQIILCSTIMATAIVLVVSEFLPKALFRINPGGVLYALAYPIYAILFILRPIVRFFIALSNLLLRPFTTLSEKDTDETLSRLDLEHLIRESKPENDNIDTHLFENALSLPSTRVKDCMVPRTEIVAFDIEEGVEELRKLFIATNHSKIIIYKETIDNTLGYVHHHQMLKSPKAIQPILMALLVVPEVMPVQEVMNLFTKQRKSLAVVVDEFGGTAGIITLEDTLEEIFGEIEDEHDDETFIEQIISPDEYLFAGRLEIYYLNEKYQLALPEGEYNTLSGYIVSVTETIPSNGQSFDLGDYTFIVETMSENRIDTVRIIRRIKEGN